MTTPPETAHATTRAVEVTPAPTPDGTRGRKRQHLRHLKARVGRWFAGLCRRALNGIIAISSVVWGLVVLLAYTPFAELLTWVGTLLGGIVISGAQGDVWLIAFGFLIVSFAVSPLMVKGTIEWRARRADEVGDGRESVAADYGAAVLEDAAEIELSDIASRRASAGPGVNEALGHIWEKYFSENDNVRVLLYEINDDNTELVVSERFAARGRVAGAARPFRAGMDERSNITLARLQESDPFYFCDDTGSLAAHVIGESPLAYEAFITIPVQAGRLALGLLAVDTSEPSDLSERDGPALVIYANAIAFYLAAERRGRKTRS